MEQQENLNNTEKQQEKKQLSPQESQKRKKLIIFPIMILAFIGCMWLIFAPSSKDEKQEGSNGFNADIPLPQEDVIIGDKKAAYEQEQMREKQEEKMRTLQDFSFILGDENPKKDALSLVDDEPSTSSGHSYYGGRSSSRNSSSIQSSAYAYQDINRQLGSFYETPKEDPEKEELAKKVEELTSRLESQENTKMSINDQMAILERSYELAAKHMNNGNQTQVKQVTPAGAIQGKKQVVPVKTVTEQVVSGLQTEISDEELMKMYSQPRNFGFQTAIGTTQSQERNTIKACIHEEQTVMNGQNVRLRLLEPLQAGNIIIPKNTLFTGTARIQGERLDILISNLEYNGNIIPVELMVYDSDGQKGLYVPSSLERDALNEAMANVGAGIGTSFSINQDAKAAIVSDVTRSVLQGGSQYLSKKLRTAKINLKANYQVMLYAKE
jgi:conjugative transposon TraM protein